MNRRRFLGTTGCALLAFTSGCLNDPGREGGVLEVLAAEKPPNATDTAASNEQIQDSSPVQQGLQQAHTGNGAAEQEVSRTEFNEVAQALSALPWYDRTAHDTTYISGIYIQYRNEVYVVVLTPFCSDSWLIDTHSERGDYGWGGCFDAEQSDQ